MERKITEYLHKWKEDIVRKPLLIYGPKQIGKTYSVLEFGEKEYKNVVYFNTDNNKRLDELFTKEKVPDRIIMNLSLMSGETILDNDTLIVLDNVNNNEIVKGIKMFNGKYNNYHIIMITSRRENLITFKGEELQYKGMYGMDFEEYLWARGEKNLATLIRESFDKRKTNPFHKAAMELFMEYLYTGSLPEVIDASIKGKNENYISSIKQKALDTYKKEIAINSNLIDIERSLLVLDSLGEQLRKPNKKFQYGILGFGRRAKEFTTSIDYLVNNQMVYRSYKIKEAQSPLSSFRDKDSFKLYLNDEGLLYLYLNISKRDLLTNEEIKETLYENHIAKTLVEIGYPLYYYQSDGKAEVDFIIQNRLGKIIPIEIATKSNSKAKSLSVFMKKYTCLEAYRITENNFSTKKEIRYIPIYALYCLNDINN